jgi:hypothetical protein
MSRYFHHVAPASGASFFWRDVQSFAGVRLHLNLNLLAMAVGDTPPTGSTLVPPASYDTREPAVGVIQVQPLVARQGTATVELPLGARL